MSIKQVISGLLDFSMQKSISYLTGRWGTKIGQKPHGKEVVKLSLLRFHYTPRNKSSNYSTPAPSGLGYNVKITTNRNMFQHFGETAYSI